MIRQARGIRHWVANPGARPAGWGRRSIRRLEVPARVVVSVLSSGRCRSVANWAISRSLHLAQCVAAAGVVLVGDQRRVVKVAFGNGADLAGGRRWRVCRRSVANRAIQSGVFVWRSARGWAGVLLVADQRRIVMVGPEAGVEMGAAAARGCGAGQWRIPKPGSGCGEVGGGLATERRRFGAAQADGSQSGFEASTMRCWVARVRAT